jgi:hypothetical protein
MQVQANVMVAFLINFYHTFRDSSPEILERSKGASFNSNLQS